MIQIVNMITSIGGNPILKRVSFNFGGKGLAIMGRSGSGKTTLVNAISGINVDDMVSYGEVKLDGKDLSFASAYERKFAICGQDYMLVPNMDALKNASLGSLNEKFVYELFDIFGMMDKIYHYPYQLSGGEQQRIAFIRALASKPRLLLLDEPFSNLDDGIKEAVIEPLAYVLQTEEIPFMMVTHDKSDAFGLCDEIVILRGGEVAYSGGLEDCYNNPSDPYVARTLGECNVIKQGSVERLLRPEAITISEMSEQPFSEQRYIMKVVKTVFHGGFYRVTLWCECFQLTVHTDKKPFGEFVFAEF